jgi:hypothetical protein
MRCAWLACFIALWPAFAAAQAANPSVPDLSGLWNHNPNDVFGDPPSGPGPVHNLLKGAGRGMWRGDSKAPILKPWAAEVVQHQADLEAANMPPFTSQQTCTPSGVPNIMQLPDIVQFLQTPKEVAIIYARDHQVRIVHMNVRHPANLTPSWYGDSVGHYEGDTLVVDTIGQNEKNWTDRMGTPHTGQIHVVERYHTLNDGHTLRVDFTVEDPGAFTSAWSAYMEYARARGPIEEQVCAENPRDLMSGKDYPIPTAN